MRMSKIVTMANMVLVLGLTGAAVAAPAAAADVSCQKFGGEISALIDTSATAKNLPAARAAFQAGIMDCMEGDDVAANAHYQEARALLTGEAMAPAPARAAVRMETPTDVDCQKLGGEVSALIDRSGTSKNLPAARAAFQAGIMQCMEGDDVSANTLYRNAKTLLSE